MANSQLFRSHSKTPVPTDAVNEAGGVAYALSPKAALAQLASTGCLNGTYYASGEDQLAGVLDAASKCADPSYVAKVAIWARERGHMKDMPALLAAWLLVNDAGGEAFGSAFARCIDTGKQLSNVIQILRSGRLGRKAIPRKGRRAMRAWLSKLSDQKLLQSSVGFSDPSMADILRMLHPKPETPARAALFGWISGRNTEEHSIDRANLPQSVRDYDTWKGSTERDLLALPDVPWAMLTSNELSASEWKRLVPKLSWQWLRMNLNTMSRQGVFADKESVALVAKRLRDPEEIRRARVFPYQLLVAYLRAGDAPRPIIEALHDAMEAATMNVPEIAGGIAVFPDVSGSMSSAITGARGSATSKVSCVQVAALVSAALARRNPDATIIPFDTAPRLEVRIEPRDSVMTNAGKLSINGGGTACCVALMQANLQGCTARVCVYISDNQSWVDSRMGQQGTATMQAWIAYKARVKDAVLVCINLQPYATSQASNRPDVLNLGGFSDSVFDLLASVAEGGLTADLWQKKIEAIVL